MTILSASTDQKALDRAAILGAVETTVQLGDSGVMQPAERPMHIEWSKRAGSF